MRLGSPLLKSLAVMLALLVTAGAVAALQPDVPVMVGGDSEFPACGATGEVVGLDPAGDNFLAVRSGPSSRYEQMDEIHTGDIVFLCDEQGDWLGIVYPDGECGVMDVIEDREAYGGDCKSGWVFAKYIRPYAG